MRLLTINFIHSVLEFTDFIFNFVNKGAYNEISTSTASSGKA